MAVVSFNSMSNSENGFDTVAPAIRVGCLIGSHRTSFAAPPAKSGLFLLPRNVVVGKALAGRAELTGSCARTAR